MSLNKMTSVNQKSHCTQKDSFLQAGFNLICKIAQPGVHNKGTKVQI